jgi:hypothetical protein
MSMESPEYGSRANSRNVVTWKIHFKRHWKISNIILINIIYCWGLDRSLWMWLLSLLKPSGYYMYHLLQQSVTLHFSRRVYLWVSYDSQYTHRYDARGTAVLLSTRLHSSCSSEWDQQDVQKIGSSNSFRDLSSRVILFDSCASKYSFPSNKQETVEMSMLVY